jgi:hypothetical protein
LKMEVVVTSETLVSTSDCAMSKTRGPHYI